MYNNFISVYYCNNLFYICDQFDQVVKYLPDDQKLLQLFNDDSIKKILYNVEGRIKCHNYGYFTNYFPKVNLSEVKLLEDNIAITMMHYLKQLDWEFDQYKDVHLIYLSLINHILLKTPSQSLNFNDLIKELEKYDNLSDIVLNTTDIKNIINNLIKQSLLRDYNQLIYLPE